MNFQINSLVINKEGKKREEMKWQRIKSFFCFARDEE